MRKVVLLALLALALPVAASATSCPMSGTYATLIAAGSCSVGNLTFSGFSLLPTAGGGATLPTASSISFSLITTAGNEGFNFNPGFIEGPGQSQDASLSFTVTAAAGSLIDDLSLAFNGAFTGTGATSFSETYCTGPSTGCNVFSVTNPPLMLTNHIDIKPTSTLFITKDFGASAGATGSASISMVTNQYSNTVVPEPGTLGLLGTGLMGLAGLLRRKLVG